MLNAFTPTNHTGADNGTGKVVRTAQRISKMKATAGWETTRNMKDKPYRGLKLHLHEAADTHEEQFGNNNGNILVWTFCCVYDSKKVSEETVKAFLTKLLYVSEPLRATPWWRDGETLSAQPSFAPTLQQQMEAAEHTGKMAMLNQHVEETKAIMASNIENILEQGEKIEDLQEESKELSVMAQVFKKKAKQVKRFKMWQNAKHGIMVGTAVTAGVGVIVIPPLIALL